MNLLRTKALWVGEMILGKIDFSLLARTLATILYRIIQKFLGLKSPTLFGSLILGIKQIKVALMLSKG